jgi:hypothetical protein
MCAAIDALFANSSDETLSQDEREYAQAQLRQIGDISAMVNAIVGAVLFTLLFLTGNTMMQSVRERIPELAVLKAIGFSDGMLTVLVLVESLLLCLVAALAGACGRSGGVPGDGVSGHRRRGTPIERNRVWRGNCAGARTRERLAARAARATNDDRRFLGGSLRGSACTS